MKRDYLAKIYIDMPKSPQPEVRITKLVATDLLLFAQANKEMLMPTEAESVKALQQAIRSALTQDTSKKSNQVIIRRNERFEEID